MTQSEWIYAILQEHGFEACVEAFKQNIQELRRDKKLEEQKRLCLQKLSVTTADRDGYIQAEISKYEKCMRDSIGMANDNSFCSVYNVISIICNYVVSEAIRDELKKQQVTTPTQNFNPKPQQKTEREKKRSKPTRSKGRPKETLKDKMIDDVDGNKLKKVHIVMDGKKGKDAALIILACINKGWMLKPTFTQVIKEFGDIGTQQNFVKYLQKEKFTEDEIEGAINSLD